MNLKIKTYSTETEDPERLFKAVNWLHLNFTLEDFLRLIIYLPCIYGK